MRDANTSWGYPIGIIYTSRYLLICSSFSRDAKPSVFHGYRGPTQSMIQSCFSRIQGNYSASSVLLSPGCLLRGLMNTLVFDLCALRDT